MMSDTGSGDKMNLRGKKLNVQNINVQSPSMFTGNNVITSTDSKINALSILLSKKLDDMEKRLMGRINSLSDDLNSIRAEVSGALDKIIVVENSLTRVTDEVAELRAKVKVLGNDTVAGDLVLHGLPNDANMGQVVEKVVTELECCPINVRDLFRVGPSTDNSHRPVVIKLGSANERVRLLSSLAAFRKQAHRPLQCSDVGLPCGGSLLFYESLTTQVTQSAIF